MSNPLHSEKAGFSIVESLVALAVFAMAGVALGALQAQSLTSFARVEATALANVVAQNRLTELIAANDTPEIGEKTEELDFANRAWTLEVKVAATPDASTRRLSVAARGRNGEVLALVHGFVVLPPAPGA